MAAMRFVLQFRSGAGNYDRIERRMSPMYLWPLERKEKINLVYVQNRMNRKDIGKMKS